MDNTVRCTNCAQSFKKDDLQKSCSNCFCCTGCEIYICASCGEEIIICPIGEPPAIKYHKSKDNK